MDIKLTYEDEGFEGSIIISCVKNSKRGRTLKAMGIKDAADLENFSFDAMDELIEKSEEYYKEIDLKKGGQEYKSFGDLDDDPKCSSIMQDCATKIFIGLGSDEKK